MTFRRVAARGLLRLRHVVPRPLRRALRPRLARHLSSLSRAASGYSAEETAQYGLGLRPGDPHHRAFVGPPEDFDLMGALQFGLLVTAGMRETHRLLDVGCGSLRLGRLAIVYLRPGGYYGIEPARWLVEKGLADELGSEMVARKAPSFAYVDDFSTTSFGVRFDYVMAQSIFSHTHADLASVALRNLAASLAPQGVILGNFLEGSKTTSGTGWEYPGLVEHTEEDFHALARDAGLGIARLQWPHRVLTWFVAALPEAEDRVLALAASIQPAQRPS